MSLVLTKAALALKNAEDNFKFVKFEAYKPKKKDVNEVKDVKLNQRELNSKKDQDLKKIRHEVVKFGMSGFDPSKKEEARIALAVSLGAKPPKKEYLNYKELMKNRKQEKKKLEEEKQAMKSKGIMQRGAKKKKSRNDVGHFLDGYGKVQKKDLKKDVSSSKASKKKRKK